MKPSRRLKNKGMGKKTGRTYADKVSSGKQMYGPGCANTVNSKRWHGKSYN